MIETAAAAINQNAGAARSLLIVISVFDTIGVEGPNSAAASD